MTPRRIAHSCLFAFTLLMLAVIVVVLGAVFGYWSLP